MSKVNEAVSSIENCMNFVIGITNEDTQLITVGFKLGLLLVDLEGIKQKIIEIKENVNEEPIS